MGRIPDELREIIADNIRKCRMKKFPGRGGGKKCAEAFGVSPQQWSPWERGMRTPDEDRMILIAKFFNVSVAYLRQDRRSRSDDSFWVSPPTGSSADGQSYSSPPNAEGLPSPYGDAFHRDSQPQSAELPPFGTAPILGSSPLTGGGPHSGNETYWLLAKFFSSVTHNGIIVRLTPQDMDYLGDCIAQALIRRGVVFPPQR